MTVWSIPTKWNMLCIQRCKHIRIYTSEIRLCFLICVGLPVFCCRLARFGALRKNPGRGSQQPHVHDPWTTILDEGRSEGLPGTLVVPNSSTSRSGVLHGPRSSTWVYSKACRQLNPQSSTGVVPSFSLGRHPQQGSLAPPLNTSTEL